MAAPEVLSFREFRAGLAGVARAVAALSASRLIDLERRRLPGRDDLARPQAFHRYILATSTAGPGSCAPCPSRKDQCSACRSTWSLTPRTCSADSPQQTGCGAWPATRSSPPWPGPRRRQRPAPVPRGQRPRPAGVLLPARPRRRASHRLVRMDPDRNMAASAAAHRSDLALLRKMPGQLTDLPHPSKPPGPEGGPAT